jgi:hypothetical protein
MSVQYMIKNDIVEFLMGDRYSFDEFKQICLKILSDPDFKPCMKGLVNLLQARPNPPTQELREGAAYLGSVKGHFISTWAVLAPPDSLTYGLARMFSVFAENRGIQLDVFTNRKQALNFLNGPRRSIAMA